MANIGEGLPRIKGRYQKILDDLLKAVYTKAGEIQDKYGLGKRYYNCAEPYLDAVVKYYGAKVKHEDYRYVFMLNNFLCSAFDAGRKAEGFRYMEGFTHLFHKNNYIYHIAASFYVWAKQYDKALEQLEKAKESGFPLMNAVRTDEDLKPLFEMERFKKLFDEV